MTYTEEIEYRKAIMSIVQSGEKITSEERLWLVSHPLYNSQLGYPYLNSDIITLAPDANYHVKIKIEKNLYSGCIFPVINVPGGKGKINTDFPTFNYKGKPSSGKDLKMLALMFEPECNEIEIDYCSGTGKLGISFECEYFDDQQGLIIRKNSNVGDPNYSMIRTSLSENEVMYRCKPPKSDDYDSFVFSVTWSKI